MVQIKRYGVTQGNCEPHPQGEYVKVNDLLRELKTICGENNQEVLLENIILHLDLEWGN